jgi:hypothetical protein
MEPRTLTLDGISYDVAQFSPGVQQAVAIHTKFSNQLADEQLAVLKTQSALQVLTTQISEQVQKELAEKKEAAEKLATETKE